MTKKFLMNVILVATAYILTCAAVISGPYFRAGLTVEIGQISDIKVKATRDVENTVATARNRAQAEEKAQNMRPITKRDESVNEQVHISLNEFFDRLDVLRWEYETHKRESARAMAEWENLSRIAAEAEESGDENQEAAELPPMPEITPYPSEERFAELSISLTSAQRLYLLDLPEEEYYDLCSKYHTAAENILEQGISEADLNNTATWLTVQDQISKALATDDEKPFDIGYAVLQVHLKANEIIDEEKTEAERSRIAGDYARVMFQEGQTIVDDGASITEEAYAVMEALGMLRSNLLSEWAAILGTFILIAVCISVCVWFIISYRPGMDERVKESLLIFILYTVVLLVMWAIGDADYYLMPTLLFTILIAMLIDIRVAIILNLGITLVGYLVMNGTLAYILFGLLAGISICLLARYTTERSKIMMVGLLAALINFVLSVAISLVTEKNNAFNMWPGVLQIGGFAAINGIFTVIISVGSLPLWEVLFGVVTPIKLLDLTNPTNPLLRRMTIEAPGTYHHSLIVANLAESAAFDIGANPNTARAGAYYHDIGKLKYPQYFVENLAGENPHNDMAPLNSARLIISHVSYGLTLAAEYRLPQFLRDIIQEHHGNSLIRFFYCKAQEETPGVSVKEDDYRYPYRIPQTPESALVMLADTVEAAVRSKIAHVKGLNEIEGYIKKLIRDKLNDGQLADSQLSIRDVDTISNSFFRVLKGMYHERIPYPKDDPAESKTGVPQPLALQPLKPQPAEPQPIKVQPAEPTPAKPQPAKA